MTQTISIVSFLVLVYTIFKESDSISITTSEFAPTIHLVTSSSSIGAQYVGRLEIFHNGQWGTVCNKSWSFQDSLVVCKELGCASTVRFYTAGLTNPGTGPIWLSNVNCTGLEFSLSSCKNNGYGVVTGCSHDNDVGVVCSDSNWNCSESSCNSSIMSSLLITTLSSVITTSLTSLWSTTHSSSSLISISTSTIPWYSESLIISTTLLVISSQSSSHFFTSNTFTSISTSKFILSRTLSSLSEFSSISHFVSSQSTTISSVISPSVLSTSFHFPTSESLAIPSSSVATVYSFSSSSIATKSSTLSITASKYEGHSSVIPSPSSVFISISFTINVNSPVSAFESVGSSIATAISVLMSPTANVPRLSSSQEAAIIGSVLGVFILLLIIVIVVMAVIIHVLWKRRRCRRYNFLIPDDDDDNEEDEEDIHYDKHLQLSRHNRQVREHDFQSEDHEQISQPYFLLFEEDDANLVI